MISRHPKEISNSKDLGLKVATEREALWIRVRDNAKNKIVLLKDDLEVNEELVKLAERIIKEEKCT